MAARPLSASENPRSLSAARVIRGTWKAAGKNKELYFVVREEKPAKLAAGWPAAGEFGSGLATPGTAAAWTSARPTPKASGSRWK